MPQGWAKGFAEQPSLSQGCDKVAAIAALDIKLVPMSTSAYSFIVRGLVVEIVIEHWLPIGEPTKLQLLALFIHTRSLHYRIFCMLQWSVLASFHQEFDCLLHEDRSQDVIIPAIRLMFLSPEF